MPEAAKANVGSKNKSSGTLVSISLLAQRGTSQARPMTGKVRLIATDPETLNRQLQVKSTAQFRAVGYGEQARKSLKASYLRFTGFTMKFSSLSSQRGIAQV